LLGLIVAVLARALVSTEAAGLAIAAVRARATLGSLGALGALGSLETFRALLTLVAGTVRYPLELLAVIVLIEVLAALTPLVLEARPALAQHAKIMVCELEEVFGLDPVARKLRVPRHALVLFEQLSGVAALAIVLAVARLSAEILPPLAPTAAPAAALSIVDQIYVLTM
jgi:hypothetical protein